VSPEDNIEEISADSGNDPVKDLDQAAIDFRQRYYGPGNNPVPPAAMAELAPEVEADALALNFRYFQVVPARSEQARLNLPEGFAPQQVTLTARHGGETLVEQSFEWTVTGAAP